MPKPHASVAAYIAAQPAAVRGTLRRVRQAIRKGLPQADEVISYRVPTYKINGRAVIYFAAWRNHYGLYPCGDRELRAFGARLAPYAHAQSTIRFPLDRPVPTSLITSVVRLRAQIVAARASARSAKK